MPFVSRAEWGARKPKSAGNAISSHPKGVAVHYEGPKMGSRDHTKCDDLVRSIQAFHMDTRGWVDIAYTMCVCEHGYVYEGRGVGKGSAANGTTAANLAYYAVCGLIGKGDNVPTRLTDGIRDAIDICRRNGAGGAVVGHCDLFATECPGDVLYSFVKAGAPRSQTTGGGGKSAPVSKPAPVKGVKAVKATPKPTAHEGLNVRTIDLRDVSPNVTGPGVKPLQRLLGVKADGLGGPGTRAALGAAQRRAGLTADYIFGPKTAEALLAGK